MQGIRIINIEYTIIICNSLDKYSCIHILLSFAILWISIHVYIIFIHHLYNIYFDDDDDDDVVLILILYSIFFFFFSTGLEILIDKMNFIIIRKNV
jgi:hypothetical protein